MSIRLLSLILLVLLVACSGSDKQVVQDSIETNDPVGCGAVTRSGTTVQESILGTWRNTERYLVNPGDSVERIITFNSENSFQSISTIYNGCPYVQSTDPNAGCDGWYSMEEAENGYFTYESGTITLYFSGMEEKMTIHSISQNTLSISVGASCNVNFSRM